MKSSSKQIASTISLFSSSMGLSQNEIKSKRIISKVLVALRKDYSVADSVAFCENLPEELRLLYADNVGVRLKAGQIKDADTLVSMILVEDKKSSPHDFASSVEALQAAVTLFSTIKQLSAEENYKGLSRLLPKDFIDVVEQGGLVLLVNPNPTNYTAW